MKYIILSFIIYFFTGCYKVGHQDFIDFKNDWIGKSDYRNKPYKYKKSGQLSRGNFEIVGLGLTHITKDKDGNLIYHINESEILPNFHTKKWVGKCLFYYIVDSKTYIVKGWGFDKGGNPLSCRTWP